MSDQAHRSGSRASQWPQGSGPPVSEVVGGDESDETEKGGPAGPPVSLRSSRSSTLDQLMPAILFFALYNVVPEGGGLNVIAAVLAATLWSIKASITRRRKGLNIGWWLPGLTIYLLCRATITVAVERDIVDFGISSEAVYFGIGFATKFLVGVALGVTILMGRPFLAWAVPRAVALPAGLAADPRYVRTMANATWLIVAYEIASAAWDVWLFNNSAFNLFFLARTGVNFVSSTICIAAGLFYIDRSLSRIDSYPGIVHLMEGSGAARQRAAGAAEPGGVEEMPETPAQSAAERNAHQCAARPSSGSSPKDRNKMP